MKKNGLVLKLILLVSTPLLFHNAMNGAESEPSVFNPILTAVPSLSITPDARGGGMGDVGAATSGDINSQFWNPAKYAQMENPAGFSISYTPWLSKIVNDINIVYLAGYYKLDEGQAFGASFRYFSLGNITLTSMPDPITGLPYEEGQVVPNELSVDLSYSRYLSEHWTAAVALRYIRSDLTNGMVEGTYAGNAMGADIAAYYKQPIILGESNTAYASFGVNISNIGTKISFDDGYAQLFIPTNLRIGAAFEYPFDEYNTIAIAADINKLLVPTPPRTKIDPNATEEEEHEREKAWEDYQNISSIAGIFKSFNDAPGGMKEELQEIMWSVGLEYAYDKKFLVRAGYFHEAQNKGNRKYYTFGVGFNLSVFQLNAAYLLSTAQTNPLDQTVRFSLGFDLAGIQRILKN